MSYIDYALYFVLDFGDKDYASFIHGNSYFGCTCLRSENSYVLPCLCTNNATGLSLTSVDFNQIMLNGIHDCAAMTKNRIRRVVQYGRDT